MRTRAGLLSFLLFTLSAANAYCASIDAQCEALAKKIEAFAGKQNAAAIDVHYDIDTFCDRVRGKCKFDAAYHRSFVGGYKSTAKPGNQICDLARTGSFRFLRMRGDAAEPRAQFRWAGVGVNYLELVFHRDAAGVPKIVDVYNYITGELTSDSIRPMYQIGLQQTLPRALLETIRGGEMPVESVRKFQQMATEVQSQKYREALFTYSSIPAENQVWKPVQTLRIAAARHINVGEWLRAIDEYGKHYPNCPSLSFVQLDAHLLTKKYDLALQSIDTLDKSVGGDPYLDMFRANINLMNGQAARAKEFGKKVSAAYPDILTARACYIDCLVQEKDYETAAKLLIDFERDFGWDDTPLLNHEHYGPFFKSEAYKNRKAAPAR